MKALVFVAFARCFEVFRMSRTDKIFRSIVSFDTETGKKN